MVDLARSSPQGTIHFIFLIFLNQCRTNARLRSNRCTSHDDTYRAILLAPHFSLQQRSSRRDSTRFGRGAIDLRRATGRRLAASTAETGVERARHFASLIGDPLDPRRQRGRARPVCRGYYREEAWQPACTRGEKRGLGGFGFL